MKKTVLLWLQNHKEKLLFVLIAVILFSVFAIHAEDRFDRPTEALEATEPFLLASGSFMEQELDAEPGQIFAVNVDFGTYARKNTGLVTVRLYEDDQEVTSWSVSSGTLEDNAYHSFKFDDPFTIKEGSTYRLYILEQYEGENGVAVYTNGDSDREYVLNGEIVKTGSVCYTLTYRDTDFQHAFIWIGCLVTILLVVVLLLPVRETVVMTGLLLILFVCYMWRCPLGMVPDENSHYLRAYEVANVSLVSQHVGEDGVGGNYLPANLLKYKDPDVSIDKANPVEYQYGNTALYSPVTYLPQAIGIKVVGLFTDNTSAIFYGARYGNAIACFLLCVLTLLAAPFGKRIFFLLMAFPLTLQEMISASPDGFTIALCLFFTAYILRLAYGDRQVQKKDIVILAVAGIVIALCKIVYVVMLLLLFMIPREKFSGKKQCWSLRLGLCGAAVLVNLIWLKISSGFLVEFNPGVDSVEQVKYILMNIPEYYATVVRTVFSLGITWVQNMIGEAMGALNIHTSQIMWFMFVVLLGYETCSCYENAKEVHKWDCLILIATFLAGAALIFTSLYVQWTYLKADMIEGIQGRYFIPILATFLFFVIFTRQKKMKQLGVVVGKQEKGSYCYLILLLCNGIALLDMTHYYLSL